MSFLKEAFQWVQNEIDQMIYDIKQCRKPKQYAHVYIEMDSKNMYSQTCLAIYTKLSICTCKYALIRYGKSEQKYIKAKVLYHIS